MTIGRTWGRIANRAGLVEAIDILSCQTSCCRFASPGCGTRSTGIIYPIKPNCILSFVELYEIV